MRKQFRSEDVIRDGKPPSCPECPKYKTCTQLCDAVENWVDQDRVGRSNAEVYDNNKEVTRGWVHDEHVPPNDFVDQIMFDTPPPVEPDKDVQRAAWETFERLNMSKKSHEFAYWYYKRGLILSKVAAKLKISAQAANDRRKTLKREMRSKLARLALWDEIRDDFDPYWLNYYDMIICLFFNELIAPKEIAEMCGCTASTIYHIINNFHKNLDNRV